MPQHDAAQIAKLCDDWCAATATPDGGLAIGPKTEKFRLLANGIVFHELGFDALCAALLGLSKVLLRPGLNTIVDHDHFGAWSWCGELLLGPSTNLFSIEQQEIKSLFETTIHAALAHCRKPTDSKEEWELQNQITEMQPHHAKQLLREATLVLAYMALPLLEAVLKRACKSFVSFDGQVVSAFTVEDLQGDPRPYGPRGSRGRSRCSSVRDLLLLHHLHVAEPALKSLVNGFRNHIAALDCSQDPFDVIYSWRNQSLHGTTNFQTIGGTLLTLALLISLFEIREDFDQHKEQVLKHCRWEAQSGYKSPWSFYPPY